MGEAKDWWAPREIKFTREQVRWLLSRYTTISNGQWPREPRDTGYEEMEGAIQAGKSRKRSRRAPFETPCEVCAELDERMKVVGEDSSILRDLFIIGLTEIDAAELRRISERTLRRRKNYAMFLMTGVRRKKGIYMARSSPHY